MQIRKIARSQNFGSVFIFNKALNELRANGSHKCDIEALTKCSLWGRSARITDKPDNGYYLASCGYFYFLANKPTASDIIAKIDSLNRAAY